MELNIEMILITKHQKKKTQQLWPYPNTLLNKKVILDGKVKGKGNKGKLPRRWEDDVRPSNQRQ